MTTKLSALYGTSLSLLTDLYQLTMAYGYWKSGVAERESVFHLFFRKNPFGGGYALGCGLGTAIDYIEAFRFTDDDVAYLATLHGNDGKPLFEEKFLVYLRELKLSCDMDAMPEGTVVFAHEPLLRITGPVLQCQLLETPLLNVINFQTLVATKAARVCHAAAGEPVLEFGLRRAQGIDGGLTASRAAYIGGCARTSNVLAGKLFGIPVGGTHAHSWVMFFDSELEAFTTYAETLPNNCIFLVDTYDTLEGVRNAVKVGKMLRERGHEMAGVRLDSGDLAHLSIEARKILDEGGFPKAAIVASNDLDEHIVRSLKEQGAKITVWGIGTKLATAYDQPALGGVYKLAAVRDQSGTWDYKIKLSEQAIKISNPGILQVRRFIQNSHMVADLIYDEEAGVTGSGDMFDILDPTWRRPIGDSNSARDLLVPIFRQGSRVYDPPALAAVREQAREELARLDPRSTRFMNPQTYPVGLDPALHDRKLRLIAKERSHANIQGKNA